MPKSLLSLEITNGHVFAAQQATEMAIKALYQKLKVEVWRV